MKPAPPVTRIMQTSSSLWDNRLGCLAGSSRPLSVGPVGTRTVQHGPPQDRQQVVKKGASAKKCSRPVRATGPLADAAGPRSQGQHQPLLLSDKPNAPPHHPLKHPPEPSILRRGEVDAHQGAGPAAGVEQGAERVVDHRFVIPSAAVC